MDWYLNNDGPCPEGKLGYGPHYAQDTADVIGYGFDGVKYDNGGGAQNMTEWAAFDNRTGRPLMIENCLDKGPRYLLDSPGFCPFNFFRTGSDIAPSLLSAVLNVYHGREYLRVAR